MRSRYDVLVFLVVIVGFAGCSGTEEVEGANLGAVDSGSTGSSGSDVPPSTAPDAATWLPVADASDPVTDLGVPDPEDVGAVEGDAPEMADVSDEPCPGCFGAPCEANEDCLSGYCTDGPDGPMCTKTCSADCPPLFGCKSVGAGTGDPVYICIYDHLQACRPCDGPGDCAHPVTGDPAACLEGAEVQFGAFCATPCSADSACPVGMVCDAIGDWTGCLPASGVCACSPSAIAEEAATSCQQVNDEGACNGTRVCTADGLTPCDASVPAAELCNEQDDDCDGALDEGFEEVGTPCDGEDDDLCLDGLWGCTADGLQCDDNDASAIEVCDDADNDCDGVIDEGFDDKGMACDGNDEDLCEGGVWVCTDQGLQCDDNENSVPERCNGTDDDCDGVLDEGFEGLGDACDADDEDLCANGTMVCNGTQDGVVCEELGQTIVETCNAADDDCDGAFDEGIAEKGKPCDGDDEDLCTDGVWFCTVEGIKCDDNSDSVVETCDDVDNDCDGVLDEDFIDKGKPCDGNDEDLCTDGVWVCQDLGLACDDAVDAAVEACNGQDDDCDGVVDEGFPELGAACDAADDDLCANGALVCNAAGDGLTCEELGESIVEACNGEDDDCDGSVPDDELDSDGDGYRVCEGDCNDLTEAIKPEATELCNDVDDDCDDSTDEAFGPDGEHTLTDIDGTEGLVLGDPCGAGACAGGVVVCSPGGEGLACSSHSLAQAETCNDADDDCDGAVDETFGPGGVFTYLDVSGEGAALGEPCGVGACAGGEVVCAPNGEDMTCSSLVNGTPESCNGIDDDCDGNTDEGTTLVNNVAALSDAGCKVGGVCGQPGATQALCQGGTYACQYNAPAYQEEESFCDSADNDCDGAVDEDLSTDVDDDGHYTPGSCAVPADDCDDGNDVVHPAYPETCDGVDNNCDGSTDPPGSAECTTLYQDGDEDGYGSGAPSCRCDTSGGWLATTPGDCYDGNDEAKPGQTTYYSVDRGDGSFDYNCDQQETKEPPLTSAGDCAFLSSLCNASDGWSGSAPGCGGTGTWKSGCHWKWAGLDTGCYWTSQSSKVVKCR